MKMKLFKLLGALSLGFLAFLYLASKPVSAMEPYNYTNYLMDDSVFVAQGTMSASDIQNFLQTEGSGLASFSDVENCGSTSGSHYTYYATYYSCGSSRSAAQIIYDASQAYGINPQVILATMQKEQSLVTTPNPTASQLNCAMEYFSCGSDTGFFNQVDNATWQFRFDYERLTGDSAWWNSLLSYPCIGATQYYSTTLAPGNNVTFYDGNGTAYVNFTLPDVSTSELYCYTPHVYNNPQGINGLPQYGTTGEYYSGSYNFVYYFNLWFVPYADSYYAQSGYPNLNPGQSATVWFEYQNNGNETWYDNNSIVDAPAGTDPVHLATNEPLNNCSVFAATWPSCSRPALNFSAVYDSNGTILASNQDEVQPGQIAQFSFTMTDPDSLAPGVYTQYFVPIVEGTSNGLLNNPGTSMVVSVNAESNVSYLGQSGYPTVAPDTSYSAFLLLNNSGNVPLYDNKSISSAPSGSYPVHLATTNPMNSSSPFSGEWPSTDRAANNFSAVYDSNGTTLAPNQNVAQPGQIIEFAFNWEPPPEYAAGTYQQYMQPILEGTSNGYFGNLGISWTITVPSTAVIDVTNNPSISLTSNEPGQLTLGLENVGNTSTSDNVELNTSTGEQFSNSSWTSTNTVETLGQSLSPGSTMNTTVSLLAPTTYSSLSTVFDADFDDSGITLPSVNATIPANIAAISYSASFVANTPTLTLASNQTSNVIFKYQNTGNQPWYDDDSIGSATWRSAMPTHLATENVLNRSSGFDYDWPNAQRPATVFAAVYDSNGTTLAPNQHIAQEGQIVEFSFTMSPENWVGPGVYNEYFQPIIEGTTTGAINYMGSYVAVTVLPAVYSDAYHAQSGYPSLSPGQSANVWIDYVNTGNQTWYDNNSIGSAPAGVYPVHLATNRILNRCSDFAATWPSCTRPDLNFSAVYDSNGTTLAPNQDEVEPGQIAQFSFTMTDPDSLAPGIYPEYFVPVAEGSTNGLFNDPGTVLDVTVL